MKDDYTTNSHYITYKFLFRKAGRVYFLNLGVKGLSLSLRSSPSTWSSKNWYYNHLSSEYAMKCQVNVLHTVWCYISREAAGGNVKLITHGSERLRWYRRLNWPFLNIFLNVHNIINIHWIRSRFSGWVLRSLRFRIAQASVECKESEERGLIINHRLGGNLRFLVSNSISQFDIFTKWTWLKSKLFHRSTSQKT